MNNTESSTSVKASTVAPTIFYIDFLRFIAVIAVIAIHVLGPLRTLYGDIPLLEWLAPASINASTRWAVPVFIMITGALLLSNTRPFSCQYYLAKRLGKVVVPFIGWSIIYALVTAFYVENGNIATFTTLLNTATNEPMWYHLWFFYDFIPLYFVIPFLAPVLKKLPSELIKLLLVSFAVLFLMHWLKVESFLRENLILYTGYLVIGWYLFNRDNRTQLHYWIWGGVLMLIMNIIGTWLMAEQTGKYSSLYMGYKTINTLVIAGALFVLAQTYADNITGKLRSFILLISKYSLGIYLLHPLLLLPVRDRNNGFYDAFGTYWLSIPLLTLACLILALSCTIILIKLPLIKRLVP